MRKFLIVAAFSLLATRCFAQVDVEHRRTLTIQTGFAVADSEEQLGGFGFYWFNENNFPCTNMALRVLFAGIYADAELSYFLPAATNTAIGVGFGGGVFVDSITPYAAGERLSSQEFYGDNVNLRLFVNQTIPNPTPIPLNLRGSYIISGSFYRSTDNTTGFVLPSNFLTQTAMVEFRAGGIEPGLTARRGVELYVAADANYRSGFDAFGPTGSLFPTESSYQRVFGSLAGKIPLQQTTIFLRVAGGLGDDIDQLSAWKLGGNIAGVEPYTYTIHGYYTREIFAEDFGLVNIVLSQQLMEKHNVTAHLYGDYARAHTVAPQDGDWHDFFGAGAGVSFRTFWDIDMLINYGYGFNAIRNGARGGHEVGLAFEKQF